LSIKILDNTEGAINDSEKLASYGAQNEEKQNKNNAICVGYHYM